MKFVLYGDSEHEPNPDTCGILANEVYLADLLPLLVIHLNKLEFEAKKDFTTVFNNLLRRQVAGRLPTVEYIVRNHEILDNLVKGYESQDIALTCGAILRECIKHEPLAKLIITSERFWDFFKYVEVPNFDVASDAFATFKDLLTKHKGSSAEFLEKNYDRVFEKYTLLLNSQNYVTRRQSLKLLGELLLDNNRSNFNIMTKYISSSSNLKLMMILLRDVSACALSPSLAIFLPRLALPLPISSHSPPHLPLFPHVPLPTPAFLALPRHAFFLFIYLFFNLIFKIFFFYFYYYYFLNTQEVALHPIRSVPRV
eukprot:Phypoly_transcript_08338.p1 GENE.Phypoly_transcript_08338~~Phypoly_transcript_08338.p1  ORF type:complete len:312 (+),score=30.97 Phypoly_transcript_08338:268-1203(+)